MGEENERWYPVLSLFGGRNRIRVIGFYEQLCGENYGNQRFLFKKLKTLQQKSEKMNQKLDQIDNASGDAWKDIKEGVDNAWQSLNEAIRKARSHFD